MKPYLIDLEKLDGTAQIGIFFQLQGAMTVRDEPEPLEGVHQSTLRMSMTTAIDLHAKLNRTLVHLGLIPK